MKTFKEFKEKSPITLIAEQVYFKVSIPDLSTMFMKASSEAAVKMDMRMELKPDVDKEVSHLSLVVTDRTCPLVILTNLHP